MEIKKIKGKYYRLIHAQGGGKAYLGHVGDSMEEVERNLAREREEDRKHLGETLPAALRKRLFDEIGQHRAVELRACVQRNRIAFMTDAPERFVGHGRRNPTTVMFDACRIPFTPVTSQEIEQGALKNYDLLFCPGGFGYEPPEPIANAMRDFLRGGGGYIGFCAGAFLPLTAYLGVMEGTYAYLRQRGSTMVRINPRDPLGIDLQNTQRRPVYALYQAPKETRRHSICISMYRANGPLLLAQGRTRVSGYFDSDQPYGAVMRAGYGRGRVVVFSVHPDCFKKEMLAHVGESSTVEGAKMFINAVLHSVRRRGRSPGRTALRR